jgi:hypothetical protein
MHNGKFTITIASQNLCAVFRCGFNRLPTSHSSPSKLLDNKAVNRSRRSPSSQAQVSWRRLGYRWCYVYTPVPRIHTSFETMRTSRRSGSFQPRMLAVLPLHYRFLVRSICRDRESYGPFLLVFHRIHQISRELPDKLSTSPSSQNPRHRPRRWTLQQARIGMLIDYPAKAVSGDRTS